METCNFLKDALHPLWFSLWKHPTRAVQKKLFSICKLLKRKIENDMISQNKIGNVQVSEIMLSFLFHFYYESIHWVLFTKKSKIYKTKRKLKAILSSKIFGICNVLKMLPHRLWFLLWKHPSGVANQKIVFENIYCKRKNKDDII